MTSETITLAFVIYLFARYVAWDIWLVHAATRPKKLGDEETPPWRG
jgi:hypothetical protein